MLQPVMKCIVDGNASSFSSSSESLNFAWTLECRVVCQKARKTQIRNTPFSSSVDCVELERSNDRRRPQLAIREKAVPLETSEVYPKENGQDHLG